MGFWTKVRGLLGLGAIGAGLGAVFGTAWFTVSGFLAGTLVFKAVANAAVVYGSFGFFTAAGLGLLLANARSRASLDEIGVAWSGVIGAVAGAAFPLVFNILMLQSLLPLRLITGFLPIMGTLGLFGGALAAGMVAAAKYEDRRELGPRVEAHLLEE
jgi:hypothetical protein